MVAKSHIPCDAGPWTTSAAFECSGCATSRRPFSTWLWRLVVILSAAGWASTAWAQQDFVSREADIKAAYLYNFGKYVEWPSDVTLTTEDKRPAFFIGVVGKSPVISPLQAIMRTKTLRESRIVIRQIRDPDEYRPCHIVFVPDGQEPQLVEFVLKQARRSATLTVGETEGFAAKDGMVNFYVEHNKLKFEVNPAAARGAGLAISSKLLRIGRLVPAS